MSENKMMRTPGPWKVFGDIHAMLPNGPKGTPYKGIERVGRTEGENVIALLIPNDADACLIAAAPELLEALKRAISDPEIISVLRGTSMPDPHKDPRAFVQARAAIAKAEAR